MSKRVLVLIFATAALSPFMAGCGGGGGGSSVTSPSTQIVTGTVAAPGGTISPSVKANTGSSNSTATETGIAGLTVTVGTISAGSSNTSFTFTPITGATATTTASGTFSVTLPAGTSLNADMVVVASQGAAPTTLPATNVLVTPVVVGTLLVDPATTVATMTMCQQFNGDKSSMAKADLALLKEFLLAVESAAGTATGSTLSDLEDQIQLLITVDPGVSTTLSGVVVSVQSVQNPPPPNNPNTLTSAGAFTTGLDTNGKSFSGDGAAFTANFVNATPQWQNKSLVICGMQKATLTTPQRLFTISVPISGPLAAGTYTGSVTYTEQSEVEPDNYPNPGNGVPNIGGPYFGHGFGPGSGFFRDVSVSVWSAQTASVTVATDATVSTSLDVSVASATFSPVTNDHGTGSATGTFTTSLTGTLAGH